MSGLLIPDDWDEQQDGFCTLTVTVPNSPLWKASVRGALVNLTLVYQWEPATGDAEQAASIGQDIYDTIDYDCP